MPAELKLATLPKAEPNAQLVGMLKEALGQAEAGDLRSMIWLVEYQDGSTRNFWAVDDVWVVKMLGALRMLMRDWEDHILDLRSKDGG